jgi:hypothetical protein
VVTEERLGMEFFKTDDGRIHVGRLAGIVYVIGLVVGCDWSEFYESCTLHLIFTVGWWLAAGGKYRPRSFRDTVDFGARPVQSAATVMGLLAIGGESYYFWFIGHHLGRH